MTELDHEVCDTYLYYRRQGYSRDGSIYLTMRELVMSRAVVIGILSCFITPW